MSRIQVAVEFYFPKLDDESAKAVAKQIVEARGFAVAGTRLVKTKGEGKPFTPKAGKPGARLGRDGRTFEVWSEGPNRGDLWVVPVERRDDDVEVYLTREGAATAQPYHSDGKQCRPTTVTHTNPYRHETVPCAHPSHQRVAVA